MMVFGISGRVIASATVGTAFIMILISANYFITSFRGNELAIIDFLSIRTALNVGTHHKFELYEKMKEELKEQEKTELFEAYEKSRRSYEEVIDFLEGKADI